MPRPPIHPGCASVIRRVIAGSSSASATRGSTASVRRTAHVSLRLGSSGTTSRRRLLRSTSGRRAPSTRRSTCIETACRWGAGEGQLANTTHVTTPRASSSKLSRQSRCQHRLLPHRPTLPHGSAASAAHARRVVVADEIPAVGWGRETTSLRAARSDVAI